MSNAARIKPNKKKPPMVSMIISYVPLLRPDKTFLSNPSEIKSVIEKTELTSAQVKACLWSQEDGVPTVSMIMERALDIKNHMVEWAENEVEKWFTFGIIGKDDRYAFALMPDVKQSIERIRLSYQLQHGWPLPEDTKFQVYFAPISFLSRQRGAYDVLEEELHKQKRVQIYLVDYDEKMQSMAPEELQEKVLSNRYLVGTVSTETPDANYEYIDQMFQE